MYVNYIGKVRNVSGSISEPDPVTGIETKFISVSLEGENQPYLWGFANDFITLPEVGQTLNLSLFVKAKVKDGKGRLSSRLLSFEVVG